MGHNSDNWPVHTVPVNQLFGLAPHRAVLPVSLVGFPRMTVSRELGLRSLEGVPISRVFEYANSQYQHSHRQLRLCDSTPPESVVTRTLHVLGCWTMVLV